MDPCTTLFIINSDTADNRITEAAEAAAQRGDRLVCLQLDPAPALPMYAYGASPYGGMNIPDNWSELVTEARAKQNERAQSIEQLLARSNTSGDVQSVMCATADVRHHVAQAARVSDVAFIAQDLRASPKFFHEAAYGVLFHSPIGLRLNGVPSQKKDRIFIAWNSSDAAASAVHAALPYLKEAQEVLIACIDPVMTTDRDGQDPGTDLAAWLSHHGCKVSVSQYPGGGNAASQSIQERAKEFGADLVVLGAYGHSRMIEAVFGGTTRTMIEQVDLPILLAH